MHLSLTCTFSGLAFEIIWKCAPILTPRTATWCCSVHNVLGGPHGMCTCNTVGGNKLKKHPVMQQRTSKKKKKKMYQTIPWRCDRTNRCKGSRGTCGCRWSMPCVPRQSGTWLSTCRPAWRRSAACRWCPPPTPRSRCSSCTASKSWAGNGGVVCLVGHAGIRRLKQKQKQ